MTCVILARHLAFIRLIVFCCLYICLFKSSVKNPIGPSRSPPENLDSKVNINSSELKIQDLLKVIFLRVEDELVGGFKVDFTFFKATKCITICNGAI